MARPSSRAVMTGTVKVWDLGMGQERASLKGHAGRVHAVVLSGDGKTLVSASGDNTVKIWDVASGQERATLKGHTGPVTSVALSGDGKTLVSGSADHSDQGLGRGHGAGTRHPQGPYSRGHFRGVERRRQDARLGESGQNGQGLGRGHGAGTRHPQGPYGRVTSVALSGDGKTLVSGSRDSTVKVWDVGTGQERATLKGPFGRSRVRGVERRTARPSFGKW